MLVTRFSKKEAKPTSLSFGCRLRRDDYLAVMNYVKRDKTDRSTVVRELVHEAVVAREIKARGAGEAADKIRQVHTEAVSDVVSPLAASQAELIALIKHQSALINGFHIILKETRGLAFESLKQATIAAEISITELTGTRLLSEGKTEEEYEVEADEMRNILHAQALEAFKEVQAAVRRNRTALAIGTPHNAAPIVDNDDNVAPEND